MNENKNITLKQVTWLLFENRSTKITYQKVVEDTGLSLGWLQGFVTYPEKGYGVDKIQKLYEYLAGKPLFDETNTPSL